MTISGRLKAARAALGLSQTEAASGAGVPVGTLRKYEQGPSLPGAEAIAGFVRLGINANWLLTGDGPMLLAELAPKPAPVKINIEALAASLDAMRKLAKPGESPEALSRKAAQFYQYMLDQGLITPEGQGEGYLKKAV